MTIGLSARHLTFVVLPLFFLLTLAPWARADEQGEGPLVKEQPKGITPEEIIQRFAVKEKQFKEAREQYTWRQDVLVKEPDTGGEFKMVTDVLFDQHGKRVEHVVFAPQSTLQQVSMSQQDFDDIEHRLPFVLTSDEIPEYDILYVGQQQEDELHTYVFDVAPKEIKKGKRYFQGRIWVDDRDFQIVKTHGKNVPDITKGDEQNLFPPFTTWREQIDGKYWFPTYTKIDAFLHFKMGDVHIIQIVKYENYKRFGSSIKITYDGQEVSRTDRQPNGSQTPSETPPTQNPKQ